MVGAFPPSVSAYQSEPVEVSTAFHPPLHLPTATMESFSNDWDETFQYLSREMLVSELMSTDLQQQVPTPPVRCEPLPLTSVTPLTLLLSTPVKALGQLLALSHGEYNGCLCLDHILSRG